MRRLVITRGPQGAGKSTTIAKLGLDAFRLCADDIRRLLASPVLSTRGDLMLSHDQEDRVWTQLNAILDERMRRGELIVLDATHPNSAAFKPYLKLAYAHRYRLACLDFSTIPLELALERNRRRAAFQVVPEDALRRTYQRCCDGQVPESVKRFCWAEDGGHEAGLAEWLHEPIHDVSGYRRVHHIGDLQGCLTPLLSYLGPQGFVDDELYIFVGDLCDRGIENAEVLRFMFDAVEQPNVVALWGNHEEHLHRFARGLEPNSDEFRLRTLPQLLHAGITSAQVDALCDALLDCYRYRYGDTRVMVTHAGLVTVPSRPEQVSSQQFSKGTGRYSDPVDEQFDALAPPGWYQVHGHRNARELPIRAAERSFNLEGAVEFGGELRCLVLDANGFEVVETPNPVYLPYHRRTALKNLPFRRILPPWVDEDMPNAPRIGDALLTDMREHELVYENVCASRPHISAFNFTRDAFFQRAWDSLNVTARGLFVDNRSGDILARSYDKFFNLGERPETEPEQLAETLVFPVHVYLKENGYLGILGYDARATDGLLWTSKSSPDSDFSRWFQELGEAALLPHRRRSLARWLRDTHASMVFEVVDPDRDPHIIAYSEPQLVLLDVVRRHATFERTPYESLRKVGEVFGFEVKARAMVFPDFAQLEGWLQVANRPDYLFQGRPVEGFVLEDAAGFLVKIKLDFYTFWKRMRSLVQRERRCRRTGQGIGRDLSEPRVAAFHQWLRQLPDDRLEAGIIALRAAYLSGEIPAGNDEPQRREAEDKETRGFKAFVDSLAQRVEDGQPIKTATADALLSRAMGDDRLLSLLHESALRVAAVLAASEGPDRDEAAERLGVDIA